MFQTFKDRREAGITLAKNLIGFAGRNDTIVLALPRGGVPVAFEVAKSLNLPLDVLVVRKLGVPGQPELAFGAVASGGARFLNEGIVSTLQMSEMIIESIAERENRELERRERLYRGERPAVDVRGKNVIIVDDGLATGATMRVAIRALRKQDPKQIIVAVPVAAQEACTELHDKADVLCVCAESPERFYAVGMWYDDFSQTTDEEVEHLLAKADVGEVYARHAV
jgi:putative phosphoribosyl transferase